MGFNGLSQPRKLTAMKSPASGKRTIGLLGCGAFGRLMIQHLSLWFDFKIHDPALNGVPSEGCELTSLADTAGCAIVILATPVSAMAEVAARIAPHLRPGALVIDVGSVKSKPAAVMQAGLPGHVDILCTHPLFGPQSAEDGLAGLKIVLCPIRCRRERVIARFLGKALGLKVIFSTPEAHDRELAVAQGLTHLIAQVLLKMEPLPDSMTTVSFDLIKRAIDMVRDDAREVLHAIEHDNPYASGVRQRFFELAQEARLSFEAD
jgi:prephenate dehydrogenase